MALTPRLEQAETVLVTPEEPDTLDVGDRDGDARDDDVAPRVLDRALERVADGHTDTVGDSVLW